VELKKIKINLKFWTKKMNNKIKQVLIIVMSLILNSFDCSEKACDGSANGHYFIGNDLEYMIKVKISIQEQIHEPLEVLETEIQIGGLIEIYYYDGMGSCGSRPDSIPPSSLIKNIEIYDDDTLIYYRSPLIDEEWDYIYNESNWHNTYTLTISEEDII